MSVFQVEEYYVFIKIDSEQLNDKLRKKIEAYLSDNFLDDFEFQEHDLVIDGIDSESSAECYDRDIKAIIEQG